MANACLGAVAVLSAPENVCICLQQRRNTDFRLISLIAHERQLYGKRYCSTCLPACQRGTYYTGAETKAKHIEPVRNTCRPCQGWFYTGMSAYFDVADNDLGGCALI
jgi:hypothetical protein